MWYRGYVHVDIAMVTMLLSVGTAVGVLVFVTIGRVVVRSARLRRRLHARFVRVAAWHYATRRRVGHALVWAAAELALVRDAWVTDVVRRDVIRDPGSSLLHR